jgi:hypothetical protein
MFSHFSNLSMPQFGAGVFSNIPVRHHERTLPTHYPLSSMKELKQLKRHLLKQYPKGQINLSVYRDHVGRKRAVIDTTLPTKAQSAKQRLVQAQIDKMLIKTLNNQRIPFHYVAQGK